MGRRKAEQPKPQPYQFYHNERVDKYFAQVCLSCGVVTLEKKKGPDIFYCWFCLFKARLPRKGVKLK
jgi:hypothetical protein